MAGLNSGSAGRCEAQPFSARFRHHAPRPQEGASTTIRQLHFTEGAILLYRAPLGRPQATPRASMVKSANSSRLGGSRHDGTERIRQERHSGLAESSGHLTGQFRCWRRRSGHRPSHTKCNTRAGNQSPSAVKTGPGSSAGALGASPAVIYSFKAGGDYAPTFISDNIIDVFGYAPAEYLRDPSFWRDRVHPDDLARVEEAVSKFFHNGVQSVEYRFRRKDGSYCWVNDEQRLIRSSDGKPLEILGPWSDITARKAAEEAKAAAHARLSQLLTSSPAVIYSYRATGDFAPTFVSHNITDWL